ncbi:MAG TPA: phosphatidylserine/phosphatidylglycerophosphate/cardiolipin synthase family protein [Nodularia sp. (in: cyanobacteria)]|nr:phosphatidylserine/phosphatidylglycerophosphate/cardiolipin synthase family protein [Nodularia sp. (in: cyanobacteria)]
MTPKAKNFPKLRQADKKRILYFGGGIFTLLILGFGFLYVRGFFRQKVDYNITNVPSLEDPRFPLLVVGLSNSVTTNGRLTGFWVGSDAIYAARLQAIREAKRTIRFETYYMTPGRRADEFAAGLIERVQAGVKVQLLLDDYGTDPMPDQYWQRLRQAGVEINFFREFDWRAPLEYNSRTHRKLLLIDGQQAMIGGAGVSDKWDGNPDIGDTAPWLEFEVSYSGQIASILEGKFMQNWASAGGTVDLGQDLIEVQPESGTTLYITDNTSQLNESSMRMLFQISFLAARKRIWMSSPYFIPDPNIRSALIKAKKNGVDVRVLTMSKKTDKPLVHFASRELYGELLSAGIQICEYQPSMTHAKLALIDDQWVSTGSANFDPRSSFHNDELNVSSNKPQLIEKIEGFFVDALASSQCLTRSEWKNRPVTERIRGRFGLLFKSFM